MGMAKNRKTLSEGLEDNDKDFRIKTMRAAELAAKQAREDINNYALSCLEEYYREYTPTSYDRTNSLKKSIVKSYSVANHGDSIVSTAGIIFDYWVLDMHVDNTDEFNYGYNASKKYIRVDGAWVIENFLEGIHPKTNGSRIPEEVQYIPVTYLPSPDEKMKKYLYDYEEKFESNLYKYFVMQK